MANSPRTPARWRVLWEFVRPQAGTLGLALILGLFVSAMELASPLAIQWVLDSLDTGASLLPPALLLTGLLAVGSVMGWWQWILLGSLAENVVYDARANMIRGFLTAKVVPLLRYTPGELVTRVTSDSVLLREAASSSLIGTINSVVMLLGTIILMSVLDLPLAAVTMGVILVIGIAMFLLMPAIGVMQRRAQSALGSLGGELEGTLRAIKTVKVANAEDAQLTEILHKAQRSRTHGLQAVRREALVWTIAGTGIQASIIVVLVVGAWRVSAGEMTVSTLVAFLLYTFGLLGPVSELSTHLTGLQAGLAAADRIREIDSLEKEEQATEDTPELRAGDTVLALENVSARYDVVGPLALRDVSLTIPTRGHTALVGLSGAGKTSVFALILRFLEPESGTIRLSGTPYDALSATTIREHISYVEQDAPLLPGTLRHNLSFGTSNVTDDELIEVASSLLLTEMIQQLPDGLDTELRNTSVSGGQRQRIAIARAIVAKPRILLLDEATAQVDGITEALIDTAIKKQAQQGAVVTIAHRLSTVVGANNIVVMANGRVVDQGTHERLIQHSPLYEQMVRALSILVA